VAVYVCSKCLFSFERAGNVENCPDCGAENVRFATEAEKAEYQRVREELRVIRTDKTDPR
jgi:rubrerythrin